MEESVIRKMALNPPPDDEIARETLRNQLRKVAWHEKRPWTREECEIAIHTGLKTREEVEHYFTLVKKLRELGYEPIVLEGLHCEDVRVDTFPRTDDGGYEIPCLLKGIVSTRGGGMDFRSMAEGENGVMWIGRHKKTGKLVAFVSNPTMEADKQYEGVWYR